MDLRVYAHVFELSMLCDTSVAGWDTTEYHLELKCRDDVDETLRSHAATMSIAEPTASASPSSPQAHDGGGSGGGGGKHRGKGKGKGKGDHHHELGTVVWNESFSFDMQTVTQLYQRPVRHRVSE